MEHCAQNHIATIYKICRLAEAEGFVTSFAGSGDDRRDGFIHLSTAAQLPGTLERHFAGVDRVVLYAVAVAALEPERLKWEQSRGGDLFPHYYAELPRAAVIREWSLGRDAHGMFQLPAEISV